MTEPVNRDAPGRIWRKRWLPTYALMVAGVLFGLFLFGTESTPVADYEGPRALPWQVSLSLLVALFAGLGWYDWRAIRRYPEAPEKWLFSRGAK